MKTEQQTQTVKRGQGDLLLSCALYWIMLNCVLQAGQLCKTCLNPNYCSSTGLPFLYWSQSLIRHGSPQDTQASTIHHTFLVRLEEHGCAGSCWTYNTHGAAQVLDGSSFFLEAPRSTRASSTPQLWCRLKCITGDRVRTLKGKNSFLPSSDVHGITMTTAN